MRKIIVLTFLTLDGILQSPGGPDEDPSGGFTIGGWAVPYFDEFIGQTMGEQTGKPFDLLLGRKTFELFAASCTFGYYRLVFVNDYWSWFPSYSYVSYFKI